MATKSPTTTVRVPRSIYDDLKPIAEKHHRSVFGEIAFALEKHVEAHQHIVDAAREANR